LLEHDAVIQTTKHMLVSGNKKLDFRNHSGKNYLYFNRTGINPRVLKTNMKTCNGNKTQDSDFIKMHATVINEKNSGRVSLSKKKFTFLNQ
jgi:hypothetical protein